MLKSWQKLKEFDKEIDGFSYVGILLFEQRNCVRMKFGVGFAHERKDEPDENIKTSEKANGLNCAES